VVGRTSLFVWLPVRVRADDNGSVSRRQLVLVCVAALVALGAESGILVALWSGDHHRPPSLRPVAATIDEVIADVVTAAVTATAASASEPAVTASASEPAVTVSAMVASSSCRTGMFARGSRFTRTADFYLDPGGEPALLARIAAALPGRDAHPAAMDPGEGLTAQVGAAVTLRVTRVGPGWLAATAISDCRTPDGGADPAPASPGGPARAEIDRVLALLGTSAQRWSVASVACPAGGRITTVSAQSPPTDTADLPDRLAPHLPATAHRIASAANRVAWRQQSVSEIVAASDDGTHVSVQDTSTC
jgi:hypothetical protein